MKVMHTIYALEIINHFVTVNIMYYSNLQINCMVTVFNNNI